MPTNQFGTILQDYLRGAIGLDEAAAEICARLGSGGFNWWVEDSDGPMREKTDALMGRVLWLTLRAADPNSVPAEPFGAAEFRAFAAENRSLQDSDTSEAGGGDSATA